MQNSVTASGYSLGEEIAHTVTHGVGLLLSIAALILMVVYSSRYGDAWHITSTSIYGATLILLYAASTFYHGVPVSRAKNILRKLDHTSIYLLIAGTYTPFTLVSIRGGWGWTLFTLVWGIAVLGVVLELAIKRRMERLSIGLYLGMGWLVVIAIMIAVLHERATALKRYHLKTMPAQVKCLVNLRPKQATDIGAVGIFPALVQLAGCGCTTDIVILFQNEDIESCLGEKGSVGEAVMTGTYYDSIIVFHVTPPPVWVCPGTSLSS